MNDNDKCFACGKSAKRPLVITYGDFYCRECAQSKSPASIEAVLWTVRMLAADKADIVQANGERYTQLPGGMPNVCLDCHQSPWYLIRHEGRTSCIPCALTKWPEPMAKLVDDLRG